jgi:hypothetical protein
VRNSKRIWSNVTFVLLESGEVQVFSADGQPQDLFKVGAGVTSLEVSPDGQTLYLGNSKSNELQIVAIAHVQKLPVGPSAVKGDVNAPVTITLFDDFQSPYCAKLVPTLDKVMAAYPKQVKVVFKHFPLSMHKFAKQAAVASIAARNQGKFWPYHDQLQLLPVLQRATRVSSGPIMISCLPITIS